MSPEPSGNHATGPEPILSRRSSEPSLRARSPDHASPAPRAHASHPPLGDQMMPWVAPHASSIGGTILSAASPPLQSHRPPSTLSSMPIAPIASREPSGAHAADVGRSGVLIRTMSPSRHTDRPASLMNASAEPSGETATSTTPASAGGTINVSEPSTRSARRRAPSGAAYAIMRPSSLHETGSTPTANRPICRACAGSSGSAIISRPSGDTHASRSTDASSWLSASGMPTASGG